MGRKMPVLGRGELWKLGVLGEVMLRRERSGLLCESRIIGEEVFSNERLGLWGWKSGEAFMHDIKRWRVQIRIMLYMSTTGDKVANSAAHSTCLYSL